jgi:hypothetical protein
MPLTQVLDPFGEPLDLWLSPNHEGQRRYVHPSELAEAAEARDGAGPSGEGATDPNAVVLCEPVPEDGAGASRVPTWLRAGADAGVAPARAPTGRVPAPSPRRRGASGDEGSSSRRIRASVGGDDAPRRADEPDETYDPRFNNESGVPTVFVTRPGPHVTCRACRDVFLDPVVAHDGFTYCRGCVPNDFDAAAADSSDAARGFVLGVDDLAADLGARERVAALHVLCRHGLRYVDSATGVGRWTHEPEGCAATMAVSARRAHEDACGFARKRCALPFGDSDVGGGDDGDADSCPMVVYRHEREKHRASCPYRLVPCSIPGCNERVRQNRLAQHVAVCDKKLATCPNLCPWRGRAGELARHRASCLVEIVACGREDTDFGVGENRENKQRERCAYRGERRLKAAHDEQCPFRGVACRHCDALVCARRLLAHERTCDEKRVTCDACGDSVLERKLSAHRQTECHKSDGLKYGKCEFHRFGCAFAGSVSALRAHAKEDAAKHLRSVALAVEASAVSYDAWYLEVNELRDEVARAVARAAKDVDAVEAETKRVVFAAASETAVSKTALADLRSFYETELLKVKEHAKRAQNASEKRIEAVLDENATLRSMLASKMTLEAAEEMKTELAGRLDECAAAAASSSAETRRHETRWSKDVARIKESVLEAKKSMTATSHELERRIQEYERLDGERVERVEKELREHVVECVGDLDDLADRQKALERRWRAANEKLREASDQVDRSEPDQNLAAIEKAQSRWAATRAADGARYRETSDFSTSETDGPLEKENREDRDSPSDRVSDPAGNTGLTRVKKTKNKTHAREATKTRVSGPAAAERQRGVHAAELLFGRGSRADPNVRARKL